MLPKLLSLIRDQSNQSVKVLFSETEVVWKEKSGCALSSLEYLHIKQTCLYLFEPLKIKHLV